MAHPDASFTVGAASYIALGRGYEPCDGTQSRCPHLTFWTKIFAIAFGMGVVTGLIMPFQFGANWSRYTSALPDETRKPVVEEPGSLPSRV
ncbi:cytochrome ubiquinol oxidase subunit I [Bradyrhizobium zhanjiangense]|uniref:cytochrome ubiquinol oxidase subunit I n=1 Tax=Bradyrhizobium zhanjiangense TaxID=1325107 RepID=UPI0019D6ADD5|nr:cytochrome ubiquinol oxidase subunit I [Bradyrhizobium zhanjiangense]